MCGLTGCSGYDSVIYANAEKYSVGGAEITDKIENIEIDWPSGSVSVVSHSGNTVLLSEKAEDGIPEELRVHWWLDGTTLRVRFAASGASLRSFNTGHKELTLAVPETLSFDDILIRAASAEIDASDLVAETLSVSTASGNMRINCAANTIKLNSASGEIQLTQKDSASEVSIDTASGKIYADLSQADTAYFESASGRIKVTGTSVAALSAKTTSGDISCELDTAPSECKLHAVSGKVTLVLPEDADFIAHISTTSGDFESDFALKKDGSSYICGSGSAGIDIDTTSGDVSIRQK
ncbi:MAG: DUF4097 family beta strand repeat-containing protein [Butyricicoccus sp.]